MSIEDETVDYHLFTQISTQTPSEGRSRMKTLYEDINVVPSLRKLSHKR